MLNKMDLSKFWSGDFGKKMSVGGDLVVLHFWNLKRALELLISVRTEISSPDIVGPLGQYDAKFVDDIQLNTIDEV